MEIRLIKEEEMEVALNLVWKVFLKYEATDYSESGIKEFKRSIDDKKWVKEREFYGAFKKEELCGVIATKEKSHIALFFVKEKYQRQGIGRKLYNKVEQLSSSECLTVNSSPYAHEIYKHLGFTDVDIQQTVNGIKFYPMKKQLNQLKK